MPTTEANGSSSMDRKRKSSALRTDGSTPYHNYKQSHPRTNNPKRGGPGILFTCETGREFKARREGLEILQQDWEKSRLLQQSKSSGLVEGEKDNESSPSATPTNDTKDSVSLTLEEELAGLRKQSVKAQSPSCDSPFALYETGCKGVVVVLFQQSAGNDLFLSKATATAIDSNGCSEKVSDDNHLKKGHGSSRDEKIDPWDPVLAVHRIAQDMTEKAPVYSSSRFITRMIPIQTTCYATIEDIAMAVQTLLQPIVASQSPSTTSEDTNGDYVPSKTRPFTFAIHEKRRFCCQMKREPLITAVGNIVGTITKENPWTVQLTNPDYTIWIEICKTLAGISIVHSKYLHPRNFNMVEWRLSLDPNSGSASDSNKDIHSKPVANDVSVS